MKLLKKKVKKFLGRFASPLIPEMRNCQLHQVNLLYHYQLLQKLNLPLPRLQDSGFRVYSQNEEDGLLLYVFSLIGTTNKICVDLAFGSPFGANTTNLICNWGWSGLLLDCSKENIEFSKEFFLSHPDTLLHPPTVKEEWVTAENINQVLENNHVNGEIDLFCLDVDGMDYWFWNNLKTIQPRVVVVEFQDAWGPDKSVTVPYDPNFNRFKIHPEYFGASLAAFVKLGREKGYRLIGCNRLGYNAFFIRNDIGKQFFPEIQPHECLNHPKVKLSQEIRLPQMMRYEWLEV